MATIQETLRRRPVIPNAAPRLVKKPVTVGGWDYPPDVMLVASAYLVQHDPEIYPDPYEFRPERFLDEGPGTYTWIPFGGGRRRCLGASFAQLEMKLVLKAVFSQAAVRPAQRGWRLRAGARSRSARARGDDRPRVDGALVAPLANDLVGRRASARSRAPYRTRIDQRKPTAPTIMRISPTVSISRPCTEALTAK